MRKITLFFAILGMSVISSMAQPQHEKYIDYSVADVEWSTLTVH